MPKYILYGGRFTRALITQMVMVEGSIDYELRPIDIVNQEHRSGEFLTINPAGLVPALITPTGEILTETPAINLYLGEHHKLTHLVPSLDDSDRGRFLSALFYITDELEPTMKRYFYPHRYALRKKDASATRQQAFDSVLQHLSILDRKLSVIGPYHLGARFSLVDLTLAYWVAYIQFSDRFDTLPSIQNCVKLVFDRPKLKGLFAELDLMREEYTRLQANSNGMK